jgi:uncharacterized protein (TIRG00374 family)
VLAALLAALALWADLPSVWRAIAAISAIHVAAALLVATADRILMAVKWHQLIVAGGGSVPLLEAVSAYYQAALGNRVVPSGIAGEAVRGFLVTRRGVPAPVVLGSMALEKLTAGAANILFALLGVAYLAVRLPEELRRTILILAGVGGMVLASAGILLFWKPAHRAARRLLGSRVPARILGLLERSANAFFAYRDRPAALFVNLLLTLTEQAVQLLKYFVLARGVGIGMDTTSLVAALAVVLFARRATGMFEAWGLAEAGSVVTLTALGADRDLAVALFAANFAVSTVAALPGLFFVWRNRKLRTTARTDPRQS